jgi:hypothetical protein
MSPIEKQRGKRMRPSLPVANHIADVANWLFIGSLVVGVVSTILIVWMAGVKEAYWDLDRMESGERIAQLNNDTERLKSDNLRLQTQLAPRSLTKEQYDAIQTLKGRVAAINLAVEVDSECQAFASILAVALMNAGIKVLGYSLPLDMRGNSGLVVYDQNFSEGSAGKAISDTIANAGLGLHMQIGRLPDALDMPRDVPAILVYEKLYIIPGAVGPYLGEPADQAEPAPAK